MWPLKKTPRCVMSIDPKALMELICEWGILWPVEILFEQPPILATAEGSCTTDFDARHHTIHIAPGATKDPELILRHELAHALDAEQRLGGLHPATASLHLRSEYGIYGYWDSPCEVFARSYENRLPELKLIRTEIQ